MQKTAFLAFKNFIFSRRGIPSDPLPFIYVPKSNSIPPELKINNIYQTELLNNLKLLFQGTKESENKARHDTNLLRVLIHGKKKWRTVYVTSFEKLSSVALGCRAGLSHSSFCECLLTSLFTFLLIRPRDQVLAIKVSLWYKLSSKAKRARQLRCNFQLFVSMKARKITP